MSRSKKSYEERLDELRVKEQSAIDQAKKYQERAKKLERQKKAEEEKKRVHRLIEVGASVESVLGCEIEKEDLPKLIAFLKKQEANGRYFSNAMGKSDEQNKKQ
ncbi:MAG: DUF3847 domain-containing protein [Eubacterium sp.]|jgi:hypothetical protein|nr:DUF3847 domain-containing protein [Eubacterium sp.]